MHTIVKNALIRWLKRADFRNIRTEKEIILNGCKIRPDVYAEKHGDNFIFEVTISQVDFFKYLPLTKNGFRVFFVIPHDNYIDDERVELYEILSPKTITNSSVHIE